MPPQTTPSSCFQLNPLAALRARIHPLLSVLLLNSALLPSATPAVGCALPRPKDRCCKHTGRHSGDKDGGPALQCRCPERPSPQRNSAPLPAPSSVWVMYCPEGPGTTPAGPRRWGPDSRFNLESLSPGPSASLQVLPSTVRLRNPPSTPSRSHRSSPHRCQCCRGQCTVPAVRPGSALQPGGTSHSCCDSLHLWEAKSSTQGPWVCVSGAS